MYFLMYGGAAAVLMFVGLVPFGVSNTQKTLLSVAAFVVAGLIGWLFMPVLAWNFYSNWILLLALGVATLFLGREMGTGGSRASMMAWLPAVVGIAMLTMVPLITTFSLFHADKYHRLLGEPVESTFDTDVSPVNINQVRRVDQDLAKTLGSKRIEEQPGLGSRVDLGVMNIQTVNGCFTILDGDKEERHLCFENELVWVGPLVHSGFFKWLTNDATPGYVLVSATDPTKVHMVTAIKNSDETDRAAVARMGNQATAKAGFEHIALRYMDTGGFWGDYVVRHVRTNGFMSDGLTDYSFEIDNSGRPHWVITQYERTVGYSGADARGVVVVDVQTGAIKRYGISDTPGWIDRIQPESIVTTQLDNWGAYVNGFWNAVLAKADVVKTTPGMSLVYGADGRSYWYSGIQSAGSDTGTNSFVLVDTRTKEVRRYMVAGANESAAKASAENAPGVREANFSGTNPILYNISGQPTYFLTLKGDDGLVKMFAFVSVRNYETVGVGRSAPAALRDYQNALIREGRGVAVQDLTTQDRIEAAVKDVIQIGDTFYLLLEGQDGNEFYGTSDVSPELKWARPGIQVVVITQRGDLNSLQIYAFDIPSLAISSLPDSK